MGSATEPVGPRYLSPVLTLVIPHRLDAARLNRLLDVVAKWPLIVVDDSDDGVRCDVKTIRLGGGVGFARAANAGLRAVQTPLALVLNDDAVPEDDCVERLAAAPRPDLPAGAVLVGPNGVESAGLSVATWGRIRQRISVDEPRGVTSGDGSIVRSDTVRIDAVDAVEVDAVSGACMRLPASAQFDERFPHGFEDVELCLRLGGARLVPSARCWHDGGGTLNRRSARAQAHAVTGQMLVYPPGWREPVIAALHVAQVVRELGPTSRLGAVFSGWRAARSARA